MHRGSLATSLARSLQTRCRDFSSGKSPKNEKIVASVLFERLPIVIPKIDPIVFAFQEFSFRWYLDEFLDKYNSSAKGDYHIEYTPAPRITEADKMNEKK